MVGAYDVEQEAMKLLEGHKERRHRLGPFSSLVPEPMT
uniref:Uncharacterized protein n=1 Tax=Arundo donax TaxID=35708 RepID=A0A0A8ZL03_ARUDO